MSRPGITYQEVANAAIQLQGQNENPTVDRVREILETGSKSTIARYLKEWKLKAGHVAGSEGISQELVSIVKGLWERLKGEASQQITRHQQETDRDIAEMRQKLIDEQKCNFDLRSDICKIDEQLHQRIKLAETLQQLLEEEKRANAILDERNLRLTQQLSEQKSEAERLHQLLSHVQTNLEHYQASVKKLREDEVLSIEKQKSLYEHETTSLKQQIMTITELKNRLQQSNDQMRAELKLLMEQKDAIVTEKNLYYQQLQDKIIHDAILQNKYSQASQSCHEYQKTDKYKSEIIIELEKKLAVLSDQFTNIKKSYLNAQDTIQILRDEKQFLTQEKASLEGQLKQLHAAL